MTDALVAHDRLAQALPLRLRDPSSKSAPAPAGLSFKHILVPLDGSPFAERALRYLQAVARGTNPRVTLLRSVDTTPRIGGRGIDPVEFEMIRADAHAYLAGVAERLREAGIEAQLFIAQGCAAEQIAVFARQQNVDLIIMTGQGEGTPGPTADWLDLGPPLGGTAHRVMAAAPTSVLIVPGAGGTSDATEEPTFRRMLLPLDLSARAEYILPAAVALARRHNAELVLAHVVPEPEMPRRMGPSSEDLSLAHQLIERNRREAARYLREIQNRLAADYDRIQTRLCVASKRARTLRELAEREGIDLVILAAHGSTGDTQQRYGGVAAKFVHEGYGPVIILQDLAGLATRDAHAAAAQHEHRPKW